MQGRSHSPCGGHKTKTDIICPCNISSIGYIININQSEVIMTTYKFTLYTSSTKICRYAGEQRQIEFTGTRDQLFDYIRYKSRTYERVTEIKVKQGDKWVSEGIK